MKLSVIIVNYNTKQITLNCLRSLDKYPFSSRFEAFLVDNASADGSSRAFRKYHPKNYKLHLMDNSENLGFAKANNQGIARARGKYILLLNSDTLVTKDALNDLVAFAQSKSDAGVVAPRLLNEDLTVQASVFRFPTLMRTVSQYWLGNRGILDKYYPNSDFPVAVDIAVGAAFLITPKAINKVGSLNEKYFMFYEDFDYCRRICKEGLKTYYLPSVEIVHLHGKSGSKTEKGDQWRRLVPGSKIYHGIVVHYLRWFVMRTSQLFR